MKRIIGVMFGLAVFGFGPFLLVTQPRSIAPEQLAGLTGDPVQGEAVFWAAGCASCHAAEDSSGDDRLILAGGQHFPSDFGTFTAPNISPDPNFGIGDWSLAEFVTAVQEGVSPEGQHYYPAFPYTAYHLAQTQDIVDLYAFMMTLPQDSTPSQPHDVGFPFNIRRLVGGWKFLYVSDEFTLQGDLAQDVARGRYLSEALAHCAECHSPRNLLGAIDSSAWLQGAPNPSGRGRIPDITPAELGWSQSDIANYLRDGFTPSFDAAGGHMASVVQNLANLPDEDRMAIAAYLLAVPDAQ